METRPKQCENNAEALLGSVNMSDYCPWTRFSRCTAASQPMALPSVLPSSRDALHEQSQRLLSRPSGIVNQTKNKSVQCASSRLFPTTLAAPKNHEDESCHEPSFALCFRRRPSSSSSRVICAQQPHASCSTGLNSSSQEPWNAAVPRGHAHRLLL